MTTSQRPRVDLDPNIFKALVIEATKQDKKPKDLIDLWVKQNVSHEVLALVGIIPLPKSTNVPNNVPKPEGDKVPLSTLPPSSELLGADDKKVLQLLKEGVTVRTEIAARLGISKSKAQEHVKLLKSLGLFYEKPNKRGTKGKL